MTVRGLLESRAFPWLVLPVLWAIAYLPDMGLRNLRLEEGRRAGPAREMLRTGDFLLPTIYGEPYLSKPPLYFWAVAAVGAIRGTVDETTVRIPAAVAALLGAWAVVLFAPAQLPRVARHLAALLLLSGIPWLDKGNLGEIETLFCLLVFAALAAWWNGSDDDGPTPQAWLWSGVWLSLAVLTKGPPALVLFYIPVIAYLARQRRLLRLFDPAHALSLLITLVPLAIWVVQILDRFAPDDIAGVFGWWKQQMGMGEHRHPEAYSEHLLNFPVGSLANFAPWGIFALSFLVPAWRRAMGYPEPLRRFLMCAIVPTFVFFWLWPISRPRHMMLVWFPAAILAAGSLEYGIRVAFADRLRPFVRALAYFAAATIAGAGVVGAGIAWFLAPKVLPGSIAAAVVMSLLSAAAVWLLRRSPTGDNPSVNAVALGAVAMLTGWAAVMLPVARHLARNDPLRPLRIKLEETLPGDGRPVYTVFSFPWRGEGWFNLHFYAGAGVRQMWSIEDLPIGESVIAIFDLGELQRRRAARDCLIRVLGEVGRLPGQEETVIVVEVTRLPRR